MCIPVDLHVSPLYESSRVHAGVIVHLCSVKCASVSVFEPGFVCVQVNQSIRETEKCFFLSCTLFPSLIRTHSVNQAWIPNTITCKVLCLGVIGLARAVFLKRLASLASLRPQPGVLSKKCSWLEEDGNVKQGGKEKRRKIRIERLKTKSDESMDYCHPPVN